MSDLGNIRWKNLMYLIEQYGTIAKLNIALGRKRKDGTLSQIKNKSLVSTTKKPREMGVALARDIEAKLNYPLGWLDQEHPEIQAFSVISPNKEVTANVKISRYQNLVNIPLFELRQRIDGKFIPTLTGDIEVPQIFIEKAAYPIQGKQLEAYYVNDNSMFDEVPFGSILVVDKGVTSYVKDGIYLVSLNGGVFIRKIVSSARGGYTISSNSSEKEHVDDLGSLRILGFAVLLWIQKVL